MRGAVDFEAFHWVKPFAAALVWGPPGEREKLFLVDPARTRKMRKQAHRTAKLRKRYDPRSFAQSVLQAMWDRDEVKEWWAHNAGKYDGLLLLAAAMQLRWYVSATVAGGSRVITWSFRPPHSKRPVRLYDSFAVAPNSLRACAEDFQLASRKEFTKDDYKRDPRTWGLRKLESGCLTDATLVLELVEKLEALIQEWGGRLKTTFSSSALSVVKAELASKGKEIPSHKALDKLWMNDAARKGYYGARVEVLHHTPPWQLTEWDVCSSYPWAMSQRLPWEPLGQATAKGLEALMDGTKEGMVCAQVTVPHMEVPPLPFRLESDGGIFFPVGSWQAWFPAVELRYAQALGVKVKPMDGMLYEPAKPFPDFVNKVYALKSTASGAVRNFSKLVLNGCYGKFSQKPERCDIRIFPTELEAANFALEHDGCEPLDPKDHRCRVLSVEKTIWSHHTHFAVGAYVTALARMKLHSAMLRAKGLAYVDSDSIHARTLASKKSGKPWERVEFGKELGNWKVEIPKYWGDFFAPKIYALSCLDHCEEGLHLAAKGFPVNAEAFLLLTSLEAVQVERMQLVKGQLRRSPEEAARMREVKSWKGLSMKRKPLPGGGTRPWTVSELLRGVHESAVSPALRVG